jgi:predicted  nucleic acid-binding Zn-ribbon protein
MLTVIHQGNKELRDKMEASNKELKESNKAFENKFEASNRELRESNNKFQTEMDSKLLAFHENVKKRR